MCRASGVDVLTQTSAGIGHEFNNPNVRIMKNTSKWIGLPRMKCWSPRCWVSYNSPILIIGCNVSVADPYPMHGSSKPGWWNCDCVDQCLPKITMISWQKPLVGLSCGTNPSDDFLLDQSAPKLWWSCLGNLFKSWARQSRISWNLRAVQNSLLASEGCRSDGVLLYLYI